MLAAKEVKGGKFRSTQEPRRTNGQGRPLAAFGLIWVARNRG